MKTEDYKYKKVITDVTVFLKDDGYYSVDVIVYQKRSLDNENWEEKSIKSHAISKNENTALNDCYYTLGTYLSELKGDLFEEVAVTGEVLQ